MRGPNLAARFRGCQLPEFFAGVPRTPGCVPVHYPGANVPQAWAAGSIFQLVTAMLSLRADTPNRTLYVNPTLDEWLPDLEMVNLQWATRICTCGSTAREHSPAGR